MKTNGFTIQENVAITKHLAENEKVVWVQAGKTISDKRITIGDTDGINTEILANVTDTDQVLLEMKTISATQAPTNATAEKSPFMLQRPGSEKKAR